MDGCVGLCYDTAFDAAREDGLLALTMHYAAKAAREADAAYTGPPTMYLGSRHEWTRLHQAARTGLAARVRVLLAAGADVNARDREQRSALFYASWLNRLDVVAALLACPGVVVNSMSKTHGPLAAAAISGHAGVVSALLASPGIDVNDGERHGGFTALCFAASMGRAAIVNLILACEGIHVNATMNGDTPLIEASKGGHIDVLRALLGCPGIDVNKRGVSGLTPLWAAAIQGHVGIVTLLLAAPGVDVNARVLNGTALRVAREKGRAAVVKLLLAAGGVELASSFLSAGGAPSAHAAPAVPVERVPLDAEEQAVINRKLLVLGVTTHIGYWREIDGCVGLCRDMAHDTARADGLLALTMHYAAKAAREADAAYTGSRSNGEGSPHQWTRLHQAARAGLGDRVRVLLAAGAGVNALDKDRRSALWAASRHNHVAVVKALLACPGVLVNSATPGKDARDVARAEANVRMATFAALASLLAANGAGAPAGIALLAASAAMGRVAGAAVPVISPLAAAAGAGHAEVVAALLAWPGIVINDGEQHRDNTALFCAASGGHVAVVELLLACPGVSVQADASGETPLSVASEHGHADVVRALLAFASTHDDAREDCSSLLFAAAEAGRVEIVRLLLAAPGVDVNAVGGNDSTPLRVARANGHAAVVELLEAAGGVE